jgi:hypothetical protein
VVVEPVNPIPDSTGPGKSFGQPPAPAEKPPVKDPRLLIDLDLDETRSLLGEPTTVREEPPVTIWSYRTGECELNVFFYPNVQSRMLKALAYEVKAETQDERTESRCFEDLVRHHARSKS